MRVFIVEDSTALRERLSRIVASIQGTQVVGFAPEANDAIVQIRQLKPDVVILDIRLQYSTGFQVLREVKNSSASADTPTIIVLTNYPYPQYRKKYLDAGADYFFDKSTEIDQVLQVLKRLGKKQGSKPAESLRGQAAHDKTD